MSSNAFKTSKPLEKALLKKWKPDGPERGGLVLPKMKLIEFRNIADNPEENFVPDLIEAIPVIDDAIGTWHTHPGALSDMSTDDQVTFIRWPHLFHAVIGSDGIHWYAVKNGAVIHA
jgi:hypothetical protein